MSTPPIDDPARDVHIGWISSPTGHIPLMRSMVFSVRGICLTYKEADRVPVALNKKHLLSMRILGHHEDYTFSFTVAFPSCLMAPGSGAVVLAATSGGEAIDKLHPTVRDNLRVRLLICPDNAYCIEFINVPVAVFGPALACELATPLCATLFETRAKRDELQQELASVEETMRQQMRTVFGPFWDGY